MIRDLQHLGLRMRDMFDFPPEDQMDSRFVREAIYLLFDRSFPEIESQEPSPFIPFIEELLVFTLELNLWWMSENGKKRLRQVIHEYFHNSMQGREHWVDTPKILVNKIHELAMSESSRRQRVLNAEGRELGFVCKAIESFVPEYTDLRVTRKPKPRMLVEKAGQTFSMDQLSDGEKCLIAMIGDIARRLAIANPTLDNPLDGEGIVLIDEIDLHLHPTWQRMVAPRLVETFPGLQFIISTHSPQVLSHVKDKSVFLLSQAEEGIVHRSPTEAYGQTYERILEDVFVVDARPDEIQEELDELFDLIQTSQIPQARDKLEDLRRRIGIDPELVRAEFLLHRKEEVAQ